MRSGGSAAFNNILNGNTSEYDFYALLKLKVISGPDNYYFANVDSLRVPSVVYTDRGGGPDALSGYILSISQLSSNVRLDTELNTPTVLSVTIELIDVRSATYEIDFFRFYKSNNQTMEIDGTLYLRSLSLDASGSPNVNDSLIIMSGRVLTPLIYDYKTKRYSLTFETYSFDIGDLMITNPSIPYATKTDKWPIAIGSNTKRYPLEIISDTSTPAKYLKIKSDYSFPACLIGTGATATKYMASSGQTPHPFDSDETEIPTFPIIIPLEGNDYGLFNSTNETLDIPISNTVTSPVSSPHPPTIRCTCSISGNTLTIQRTGWDIPIQYSTYPIVGVGDSAWNGFFYTQLSDWTTLWQRYQNRWMWFGTIGSGTPKYSNLYVKGSLTDPCPNAGNATFNYAQGYYIFTIGTTNTPPTAGWNGMLYPIYEHYQRSCHYISTAVAWRQLVAGTFTATYYSKWITPSVPIQPYFTVTNYPYGSPYPIAADYTDSAVNNCFEDLLGTGPRAVRKIRDDINSKYASYTINSGSIIKTIAAVPGKRWLLNRIPKDTNGTYKIYSDDFIPSAETTLNIARSIGDTTIFVANVSIFTVGLSCRLRPVTAQEQDQDSYLVTGIDVGASAIFIANTPLLRAYSAGAYISSEAQALNVGPYTVNGVELLWEGAYSIFGNLSAVLTSGTTSGINYNNPIAIMKSLINTTGLVSDSSFVTGGAVYNACDPSAAIRTTSMIPVLPILLQIAWECRCKLYLTNQRQLRIEYQPKSAAPPVNVLIALSEVVFDSVKIYPREIKDLVTKLILTDDNGVKYTYNSWETYFSGQERSVSLIAYRDLTNCEKIKNYWGYIWGRPWLRCSFKMKPRGALIDVGDIVQADFIDTFYDLATATPIIGKVLTVNSNPVTFETDIVIELPFLQGDTAVDAKYWTGGP